MSVICLRVAIDHLEGKLLALVGRRAAGRAASEPSAAKKPVAPSLFLYRTLCCMMLSTSDLRMPSLDRGYVGGS